MNPEKEAILRVLMESRQILEAKMDAISTKVEGMDGRLSAVETKLEGMDGRLSAVETKLDAVAVDITIIKERVADMKARDEFLTHKTGELEAELFVIKRREKA